jgi:predicted nucleotidyltransferase component of viral defense system
VLLDYPAPHLQVYSLESAVAEKLEAIVKLNFLTSRMKVFYDIHFLATQHSFESQTLRNALMSTFTHRGTSIDEINHIFSERFSNDERMNKMWLTFLKRQKINTNWSFVEIIDRLSSFIKPIMTEKGTTSKWNTRKWHWIK